MPMIHSEHACQRFWPRIGKPSNLRLCSMTGCTTLHCIVLGSGRYKLVSESTLAVTRACAGQMRGHVEHVPALDAQTGAKGGKFLDWGLTDEGVGLLRGEGCEILAQGSIGLIGYSYQ